MPRLRVTVAIPTKNEEGLVGEVIDGVKPFADDILVVDGHSGDRTRDIAAAHGARVVLDHGRGKGDAVRVAIAEAAGDILVMIDADGSHDPNDIPRLTEPIQLDAFDLVIGSRNKGGSDERDGTITQFVRYLGSHLIMLAINYRFDIRHTDCQNGFRAIRVSVARKLGLTSNVATIEQEMLMKALKQGYRCTEIPSHEYERKWGKTKILIWKIWPQVGWTFLRNIF